MTVKCGIKWVALSNDGFIIGTYCTLREALKALGKL